MNVHYIKKLSAALALLAPVNLFALEQEGSYWLIGSADDLIEFAHKANNGEAAGDGYGDALTKANIWNIWGDGE